MSLAGSRSKGLSELNHIGLIIPVITDLKLQAKGKPILQMAACHVYETSREIAEVGDKIYREHEGDKPDGNSGF